MACLKSQDEFCRIYWPVIHLTLRHKHLFSHHDAQDLAQGFVAWVLSNGCMAKSQQEKGRFRSYLLAHLDNYVRNERQKRLSQKRGGNLVMVTDPEIVENQPSTNTSTPDEEIQKAWAIATLSEAHARLRQLYTDRGKDAQFELLVPFLRSDQNETVAVDAARSLNMTLTAFRMARSRFRKEFGQCISSLVAATVNTPEDFAEEMQLIRELAG